MSSFALTFQTFPSPTKSQLSHYRLRGPRGLGPPPLSSLSSSLPTVLLADPIPDPLAYFLASENTRHHFPGLSSGHSHFVECFSLIHPWPIQLLKSYLPSKGCFVHPFKTEIYASLYPSLNPIYCFILHNICYWLTYQIILCLLFIIFSPPSRT